MTKPRAALTELEGAILGVLRRSENPTAYYVRQIFLASVSAEWSGSAGAVYPALKRMKAAGFVKERAEKDGRGTKTFTLTPAGTTALDNWLCDVERAVSPGMDPFRTRAGLWPALPPQKRRALMHALRKEIAKQRSELAHRIPSDDEGDDITTGLCIKLQELRLEWLDARLK
jgi:DNA-binding PadR family transcriptional regulator